MVSWDLRLCSWVVAEGTRVLRPPWHQRSEHGLGANLYTPGLQAPRDSDGRACLTLCDQHVRRPKAPERGLPHPQFEGG